MTKELIAATFAFALALPGAALAESGAKLDADEDGQVTAAEFEAAHPDAEEGAFLQIDANADGVLDAEEVATAREAGVLPEESSDG